ncbi:MAG TPA: MFS transporter [Syntrophorhabdaceae bacterium]|nr:MFS transporter [Syntrophorhabdaceae bacterium]HQM81142.1 MFS transporter [Syntrophorhabdaceae bacterium]
MEYYGAMFNEGGAPQNTTRNILTRGFILGFLALFLSIAANHALIPTLPIFFLKFGSNETEIGVLIGVFAASSLVSRFLVGRALLSYSKKSIMIFGALLSAATFLASIVLRPFWPFFAIRIFQGAAFAFVDTAVLSLVVTVIPPAYRGQGFGYLLLAPTLALVVAPSFGMFLINRYSFTVLFLTCMGVALCAFFCSCMLKEKDSAAPGRNAAAGSNSFFDLKIIAPAVTNFLYSFVWGALIAFVPLYAINCGIKNPGYFFSAIAIMLIAGRALGGRIMDIYNKEKLILIFVFTSMVAVVMLAFSKNLPMFIFVGLIWGTGGTFFSPASLAYALDYSGSTSGAAIGTFRAIMDLGFAVGPAIMGIIVPFTGYRIMFLCLALICLINLSYFQFYVRKKGKAAK